MNGFVKVAAAAPVMEVADCEKNIRQTEIWMRRANGLGVQIIVFPELCITGYTCMDLFAQHTLLDKAEDALAQLLNNTGDLDLLCVAGMPVRADDKLFNAAVVFQKGRILGVVPKTYIPDYNEFQEMRWFASGHARESDAIRIGHIKGVDGETYPFGGDLLFRAADSEVTVGVELCEDLWAPLPPSARLALQGANILLNLSASNEITGKHNYLRALIAQQSARCIAGYVYASAGFGESSVDLVFAGKGFIAENGSIISETERFSTTGQMAVNDININNLLHDRRVNTSFAACASTEAAMPAGKNAHSGRARRILFDLPPYSGTFDRYVDPCPFVPSRDSERDERCEEIFNIQTFGLVKRLQHIQAKTAVIGISGGLDSTLALMVACRAFDVLQIPRTNIRAVTMPGFGTTERTYSNAVALIRSLGATLMEIPIRKACEQHFGDIGHDGTTTDTAYENVQARERTQILMDLANMHGGIVVGTGDLSELALGWATYGGDHISMYGVNAGVPKTLVRYLVEWTARHIADHAAQTTLLDIAGTPVSPELIPASADGTVSQRTEEIVGPYELHDFFLYHFVRFGASPATVLFLAIQAFGQKYDVETVQKWLQVFIRRFFSQQFKRSCLPDGPKVGSISLSPRCDWRMPSDAAADHWLKNLYAAGSLSPDK